MTKREFRRLWAVPADIDARVRRMHRLEESLLKEPLVVTDTVQASGLSAPYALGTVTVRGVCAADGPEAVSYTHLAFCKRRYSGFSFPLPICRPAVSRRRQSGR